MKLSLRFYYTSGTPLSESARRTLNKLKACYSNVEFEVEEIDVVMHPSMAEEDGISVTPTIIKFSPAPIVRIVSDFSDLEKSLGLNMPADGI